MKIKINDNEPVTRGILREELASELANYPTKKELKDEIRSALVDYPTKAKVETMFEEFAVKIDEKARLYRDEILTKMDQIIGELAQIREDRLFEKQDKKDMQGQLVDHEGRIKKIELHIVNP